MVLSLDDWSNIAQILATLVTAAGVLVSLWVAVRTLREVQRDRQLRHRPYLAFQPGGYRLPISFKAIGHRIPGVDPRYLETALAHLPKSKESVVLGGEGENGKRTVRHYSELRNYGSGAAINTTVTWVPERIWINGEEFPITPEKLADPLYASDLNHIPAVPRHIEPGKHSELTRLPALIVKDYDRKITQIDGHLLISCWDIFGNEHTTKQEFHFFTHYGDAPAAVHITFSDHTSLEPNNSFMPMPLRGTA
ncbi:hypothetical protein QFW77_03040 [Luteimonas sp. RD2P54]|uniref:Uncharacterized protein n=1 Tax=Luteimonas endophytica TaxID=3042023 RepID=A0ABT6J567_9GAMM|nr:hypothetical protein [Luteimonas endophytica]MDH5821969.1 hypothetical protein [Luteimonas endophytica]